MSFLFVFSPFGLGTEWRRNLQIEDIFESDRRRMGIFWSGYNGPELRLTESLNHGLPGAICAHLKEDARVLG